MFRFLWSGWKNDHRPAVIFRGQVTSFSQLHSLVEARIRQFRFPDEGIVVLDDAPGIDFIVALLSLFATGRPAAIACTSWTPFERRSRLDLLGKCVELHPDGTYAQKDGPSHAHSETRLILFTTGSTGLPKAVQLSEENIRSNTDAVIRALDFGQAHNQTLFLPLCYSYGLLGQLFPALSTGTTTEFPGGLLELKDRFADGTLRGMISGVPSHFEAILRALPHDFVCERVTHVVTAGAFSPPDLRERLRRAFPNATLYNNYGQTEASPRILCFDSSHPLFFTSATGYAVGNLQVKTAPSGELLVKGPQIMLGYLGDPHATREKIEDGWLRTGDIASIAEDGLVTILGRNDELFNVGGERISRLEIENAIRQIPGVAGAAVLVTADDLYGIRVIAFLKPAGDEADLAYIRAQLPQYLSGSRIPRELYLVPEIPMTGNGKLDRAALREIVNKSTAEAQVLRKNRFQIWSAEEHG